MPQVWATNTAGGFMYSDNLSTILRTEMQGAAKYRQFCDAQDGTMDGYGKELHAGDQFHWNVYSDLAVAGGELTESVAIPNTEFSITQGVLTVTEYGNSVPYTSKLDDLSFHPVKEIVHKALKNDARKVFDRAANRQFRRSWLKAQPAGGNSPTNVDFVEAATFGAASTQALTKEHVKLIVDELKERSVEPYMGDDYYALGRPTAYRTFKNELENIHQYVDAGHQMILYGEIGRYEGVRFVEQTNIANGAYDPALLPTPAGAPHDAAFAYADPAAADVFVFGADTAAEAVCIPEEIRGKIPGDFGRDRGIAWYYLGGFGLVHGYDAATAPNARVLWWGSSA